MLEDPSLAELVALPAGALLVTRRQCGSIAVPDLVWRCQGLQSVMDQRPQGQERDRCGGGLGVG